MEISFQQRLSMVQVKLKAPKNQFNKFGNYKYRSCEDILEAVKPILNEHGLALTITDDIKEAAGIPYVEARAVVFDSEGTRAEVTAQAGIDPSRKGMDIAQSFGSSSSYARKYALNGLFLIDDTKDPDSTNDHSSSDSSKNSGTTKTRLAGTGEAFDRVKEYLLNGGSMTTVRQKYQISKEVEQLLNS